MKRIALCTLLVLPPAACSHDPGPTQGSADESARAGADAPEEQPADPGARMRLAIQELMARPEHDTYRVRVRHILIGFRGALPSAQRTQSAAEEQAAKLFDRLQKGGDFEKLMREFSDDRQPGVEPTRFYEMINEPKASRPLFGRGEMVPAFGDVAWRLEVGELGVAPYDADKSPFGWHIIERVK